MLRPLVTALLGVALCLAAATFDSPSLYVPGVALVLLAVVATAWVLLAAHGAVIDRRPGPHTVVEEEPYPLRVEVRSGLGPRRVETARAAARMARADRRGCSRRLRINVRFTRRGRRLLEPAVLVVRDPLRLFSREIVGPGGEEVLVLPRIEPVTAPGGGGAGAGSQGGMGAAPASQPGAPLLQGISQDSAKKTQANASRKPRAELCCRWSTAHPPNPSL